ncbi:hypothetical protein HPB49_000861 [Dermacentor silvarum]|uniref:Uncharacterized protein n=1 Tax=Dermacentor silvarum TaxID=543639 RepID=A0ACB8CNQ4_DERSI|nr:putative nuclease HARBI1 [Dermacentor silvarum]KAH7948688.1 hypothetical protein HPB49_000861 [Dermacentor silvarum]
MAAFAAAVELAFSDQSSSSSSSSSSDGSDYEVTQALYEAFYREAFSEPPRKCPRIVGFVQDVVRQYSDEEFRRNFRVSRAVADSLISRFENSDFYPRSDRGGSPSKTAEEHILVFIWFAANKACLRDVASRFGIGEDTAFRIVERMLEYLVEIAKQIITFPADLDQLSEDFEQVSGVPNTIGCIDGSYISVRCPAKKVRSTYVNRHSYPSLTLQAVCDYQKKFLDVTVGSPSKIHDSRIFRKSRLAERLPGICCFGKFHVLGDAAYPLRDYLITPFRDYGHLNSSQRAFNIKFSATRVKIENAFGDLKGRFRQLLHLDFFFVDKMNKFIISCCVLHNLCISSGDVDVPPYSDDVSTAWNWQAPPDDDSHSCGPLTSSEAALRRQGEEKRGHLIQAMLERNLPT